MKIYKKILALLYIITSIALLFTGCEESITSEEQIWEIIMQEDPYFKEYGLEITDKEITQRETITDYKYDNVYATVTASNSEFIYEAEYEINYILYDDGWHMDNFFKSVSYITPLLDCPDSLAEAYLKENDDYSSLNFQYSKKNSGQAIYYYSGTKVRYNSILRKYDITVICGFSPEEGWHVTSYDFIATGESPI